MNIINPNDFVAWLITQQNSHGSLYLERVTRHYARYLKTAPLKLDITLSAEEREVFACTTTAKFDELCKAFLAAPNYKAVNENGHQSFSAGMKAYRRYLESLEQQGEYIKEKERNNRKWEQLPLRVPSNSIQPSAVWTSTIPSCVRIATP